MTRWERLPKGAFFFSPRRGVDRTTSRAVSGAPPSSTGHPARVVSELKLMYLAGAERSLESDRRLAQSTRRSRVRKSTEEIAE